MLLRFAIMLATCAVACGKGSSTKPLQRLEPGDTAFVGATVLPMDRDGTLANHTVVVRGNTIALVAPAATIDTTGATIVDAKGKWIVPGLADMHVHSWSDHDFGMYLVNGVTTVRDMFGSPQHLEWRSAIAEGKLAGPTLITAGPIVDGDPPTWPGSAVVTNADAARKVVRDQKQAGYDFIKVYSNLNVESYEAIAAEAKAQGIAFAGHVPKAVGLEKALASGQRSIEHLDGYLPFRGEPHVDKAIVDATVKAGTWNCPTLVVTERFGHLDNPAQLDSTAGLDYVAAGVRERWNPKQDFRLQSWTAEMFAGMRARNETARKLVADLQRAGAHLVLGTDTGNPYVVPGFAVHDELALLVKAGLTPWQALRMATAAAAELVDKPSSFGVIAPNARADLLVVDRDPLRDISALAKPSLVVVRGKLHKRDELLAALQDKPKGDPFGALPALEAEGTKVAAPRYEISMNGSVIGHERAMVSKLADGTRVVRGQAVYDAPHAVFQYRATVNGVEFTDGLTVTRDGKKVIAKPAKGDPIELATTADAVIAPQAIAEFVWYAGRLATTPVGSSTTISAAEVMVDNGVKLEPATFTFKRLPDTNARRVYEINGKHGDLDLKGRFSVDKDGMPHDVEATVRWGTFVTKRVE
jgi:imidazolonepropionase-like amidohydrolase